VDITGSGVPEGAIGNEGCPDRNRRAAPMAPDDRRAAILDAAVPLLRDRGPAVTTRELAEAAGVAEGTLFRVFPDKAALVQAALDRALDPAEVVAELRSGADADVDAAATVTRAVHVLHARSRQVVALFAVAYQLLEESQYPHRTLHHKPHGGGRAHVQPVMDAVAELLEQHAGQLRQPPAVCARMLVAVVLATGGPMGAEPGHSLTPDIVADLLVGGLLERKLPC